MKISFITTIFNESETIDSFLNSILQQSVKPDEIIIVDGGSTDNTLLKIKKLRLKIKVFKGKFIILQKKGNRSVGRNEAVKNAKGKIIVCSDSGNILDKNWIKNIIEPFQNNNTDVVAGYYKGLADNVFQKCVIPYALVMPDKVNPNNFLPATRSVAFKKSIWEKVGGFNEQLSHNEDYAFAKALKKANARIVFRKDAIVYWKPRNSFKQTFVMMYRFAYGDSEARIFRPKVMLVFIRYFFAIFFIMMTLILQSLFLFIIVILLLLFYYIWAIWKNYKYIKQWQAIFILPLLQITADWAVLKGTVLGFIGGEIKYN
jgi:glycosyltransferase involved in cell wall biosynthesis